MLNMDRENNVYKDVDFDELLELFYVELDGLKKCPKNSDCYYERENKLKNIYSHLQTLVNA